MHTEPLNTMLSYIPHFTISLSSNVLMLEFNHLQCKDQLKLPSKLERLHLEFGQYPDEDRSMYQPSFAMIKTFLVIFAAQVKWLTVIVNNAVAEFSASDKIQTLISNFIYLETFEYGIQSDYSPDPSFSNYEKLPDSTFHIFTLPKPQSLGLQKCRPLLEYSCYDNLTFKGFFKSQPLYNCEKLRLSEYNELVPSVYELDNDLRFRNLVRLMIDAIEEILTDTCRLLAKLISHADNLNFLHVTTADAFKAMQDLREIIPQKKNQSKSFIWGSASSLTKMIMKMCLENTNMVQHSFLIC